MGNKMSKHDLIDDLQKNIRNFEVLVKVGRATTEFKAIYVQTKEDLDLVKKTKYFDFSPILDLHIKNYEVKFKRKASTKDLIDLTQNLQIDYHLMLSILFMGNQQRLSLFMPYGDVLFRIHNYLMLAAHFKDEQPCLVLFVK